MGFLCLPDLSILSLSAAVLIGLLSWMWLAKGSIWQSQLPICGKPGDMDFREALKEGLSKVQFYTPLNTF